MKMMKQKYNSVSFAFRQLKQFTRLTKRSKQIELTFLYWKNYFKNDLTGAKQSF